ncbi:MAG: hypothetical protein NCW75_04880 [Phycisphaera sp.]|nr:MAG: hypothetical protein NCW75_04880 [Phycisphaera sp.]
MRPMVTFATAFAVQVILAAIAIGAMVSIGAGRTSWLLIGVFVIDSIALLVVAGLSVHRWYSGTRQ